MEGENDLVSRFRSTRLVCVWPLKLPVIKSKLVKKDSMRFNDEGERKREEH